VQRRIWKMLEAGNEEEAERIYREILPLIVFIMQSLDHLVCYGKRALAMRLGIGDVHDRAPAMRPDAFGLACLDRHVAQLRRLAA
jgi:dihydrodipicolinate synthase/N-acetylneuraminate lyase